MTGCTAFLVNLTTTPPHKLAKADPKKLAEKYGVKEDWVRMCLEHWRVRG